MLLNIQLFIIASKLGKKCASYVFLVECSTVEWIYSGLQVNTNINAALCEKRDSIWQDISFLVYIFLIACGRMGTRALSVATAFHLGNFSVIKMWNLNVFIRLIIAIYEKKKIKLNETDSAVQCGAVRGTEN